MTARQAAAGTRPFLRARWSNLLLLTFEVDEALIRKVIPPELEPDRWDGRTHVSLVAFDFLDTRVLGCRVPGYLNFPEINLRTYLRHGERRGVLFIRELVPSILVAGVARLLYNEPYRAAKMHSALTHEADGMVAAHRWHWRGREHYLRVRGGAPTELPPSESLEHHFKEHSWGFGRTRSGRLLTYRVEHPVWEVRRVADLDYEVDFGGIYGTTWEGLNRQAPMSVIFAVGSEVAVFPPTHG